MINLNFKNILGDLLERLCYKTEFEVEGWRKIVPLINYIKEYSNAPLSSISLKMTELYAISEAPDFSAKPNMSKLQGKTIKDSILYSHFEVHKQRRVSKLNRIYPSSLKISLSEAELKTSI